MESWCLKLSMSNEEHNPKCLHSAVFIWHFQFVVIIIHKSGKCVRVIFIRVKVKLLFQMNSLFFIFFLHFDTHRTYSTLCVYEKRDLTFYEHHKTTWIKIIPRFFRVLGGVHSTLIIFTMSSFFPLYFILYV